MSNLGKFNGWTIELRREIHFYYCYSKDCSKESFPDRTKVGLTEEKANFRYITKQKENEEIIRKLFDL